MHLFNQVLLSPTATQTVTYTLPLPSVGQEVTLVTHAGSSSYRVTEVETHNGVVDVAVITPKNGGGCHTFNIINHKRTLANLWTAHVPRR